MALAQAGGALRTGPEPQCCHPSMEGGSSRCRPGTTTTGTLTAATTACSGSLSDVARRLRLRLLPVRPTAMATPATSARLATRFNPGLFFCRRCFRCRSCRAHRGFYTFLPGTN